MRWNVFTTLFVTSSALALPSRAAPPATRPAAGDLKITVQEVEDERSLVAVPLSERIRMGWSPRITIRLKLEGTLFQNASRMAEPQITVADDDLGNSLLIRREELQGGDAHPVDSRGKPLSIRVPELWSADTQPATQAGADDLPALSPFRDDGLTLETQFCLKSPNRRATKIARLRGTVRLIAGGERKRIEISNLPALIGHEISNPVLKHAGLVIRLIPDPDNNTDQASPPLTAFALKVAGDMAQLRDISVYEGDNDISHTTSGPKGNLWPFSLDRGLTPTIVLRLMVVYDQKPATIALELNDVRLP